MPEKSCLYGSRLFQLAKECGCKFIFGSDSHDVEAHQTYKHHTSLAADILALKEKDIAEIAAAEVV